VRHRLLEARRKDSGFTLIELLIVIVILGVLAAVVVLAVGAFDERGEQAACKSDVKAVEVAVEAYRAKNSVYPGSLNDLVGGTENYLRSLPNENSDPNVAKYYVTYDSTTGKVQGVLHKDPSTTDDDVDCMTNEEINSTTP
jgi:prepilin-type N-terminal cleavage/methylation domain